MEREVVLWAVVLFPNGGTATVLSSWFNAKEGTLSWPPKNIKYSKALKENMMPRKGWTTYENIRLLNTCDSFEKAKQHEEKYVTTGCPTTDLESEVEADVRRKRRTRTNAVYAESDEEPETSSVKRKFAKPPAIHFPVLPVSNQYPSLPTPDASSDFPGNHHHHPQGYTAPETPRGRFHAREPSQMLQDIAANQNTKMLTELLMEITRFALVGGTNAENMIRRMLSATMANRVACIFNWAGKGPKRAFKDTLMQDCMFAAARQFDRKLTELQYRGALQKWLRYAPERSGGVPRKGKD
ncbi:unnamed protein product [Arctogadus glacialis]